MPIEQTIIVSDIFGRTDALVEFATAISGSSVIFDPYDAVAMKFNDESEAYDYFSSNGGLENYADKLYQRLEQCLVPVNIIGFSVGASAIWKISERIERSKVSCAVCFYGSQIRNYRRLAPRFPIQLIFPQREKHFSVSELITDLKDRQNVKIEQATYFHGFMNKLSQHYDPTGYNEYLQALCSSYSRK